MVLFSTMNGRIYALLFMRDRVCTPPNFVNSRNSRNSCRLARDRRSRKYLPSWQHCIVLESRELSVESTYRRWLWSAKQLRYYHFGAFGVPEKFETRLLVWRFCSVPEFCHIVLTILKILCNTNSIRKLRVLAVHSAIIIKCCQVFSLSKFH